MSEYTREPWSVVPILSGSENHHGYVIFDATGMRLAEVMPLDSDGIEGGQVAAKMAAAPELYKALQLAHDHLALDHYGPDGETPDEVMAVIDAALNKAEGREP